MRDARNPRVLQKVHVVPLVRSPSPGRDPARDAARLLGWVAIAALMVGAPLVGLISRRALFVLLPVGAAILAARTLLSASGDGFASLRAALGRPLGLAALFLAGWMGLSLAWTPFLEDAAPRYLASVAVAALAALVVVHLPERRGRRTLVLLPAGLVATALATLGLALVGPASFRGGTEFDPSLLERSLLTIDVLVWPALGALATLGRWRLASALAVLVVATAFAAEARLVLAAFALAAVTFAVAGEAPQRAGRIAAGVVGSLILLAPALPFLLAPLATAIPMVGRSTVLAMTDWRTLVAADGLRLVTGHGFDTAGLEVAIGYLPAHTPRSILFEVWYELGLLGALALAAVAGLALRAAATARQAPAVLAGMVATLTIAVAGVATAELWFVTLVALQAIAFGLLARADMGAARPSAAGLPGAPSRGATTPKATLPNM